MAKVAFHNVSKVFDEHTHALRQFSLSIDDGEFMVLVGPSGCGKSTALRLLAGLESVTEGDIFINDKRVNEDSPQQRNVAMVFQNYALYPHMSVRANLAFPLKMAKMNAQQIADRLQRVVALLDLAPLLARKPAQLSGGQRQRVAMGRALVRDPSVFLLDEPLSNLDARLRAQIRADMGQIHKRLHKTTLYVTHDQVEAMTLGDRVAVMHGGVLQQLGTPQLLYEQPRNTFVAKFIGSPGMNIIAATLDRHAEQGLVVRLAGQQLCLSSPWQSHATLLDRYLQQDIAIGIRPEAFHRRPAEARTGIQLQPVSVEFLGHESLVYFRLPDVMGDELLVARLSGKYQPAGNGYETFYVEPQALMLFDAEGLRIDADR